MAVRRVVLVGAVFLILSGCFGGERVVDAEDYDGGHQVIEKKRIDPEKRKRECIRENSQNKCIDYRTVITDDKDYLLCLKNEICVDVDEETYDRYREGDTYTD